MKSSSPFVDGTRVSSSLEPEFDSAYTTLRFLLLEGPASELSGSSSISIDLSSSCGSEDGAALVSLDEVGTISGGGLSSSSLSASSTEKLCFKGLPALLLRSSLVWTGLLLGSEEGVLSTVVEAGEEEAGGADF